MGCDSETHMLHFHHLPSSAIICICHVARMVIVKAGRNGPRNCFGPKGGNIRFHCQQLPPTQLPGTSHSSTSSLQRGESEDANSGTASTTKMARNTDVIMRPNAQHASNRGSFTKVHEVSTKTLGQHNQRCRKKPSTLNKIE